MMRNLLARYLHDSGESQSAFGRRVGATGAMICRYANGTRIPTVSFALAIEKETGGKVPASYWARAEVRRARQSRRNANAAPFDPRQ